ncbi:MAG TPA: peptidylprolyl isomerase [Blastocatellia bacterium]|nr:peptidylprolyl isomerase [Blastocatellia bacterium]
MAQAKTGDTVQVHYTGTLTDGTVFDSSVGSDPLEFTVGAGQVISGFDQAVVGLDVGESKKTTVPAAEAYGDYRNELVFTVRKEQLPEGFAPTAGDQYQMTQPNGQAILVTVREVTDEGVTLDANHPLAGLDLTFDIQLVAVK